MLIRWIIDLWMRVRRKIFQIASSCLSLTSSSQLSSTKLSTRSIAVVMRKCYIYLFCVFLSRFDWSTFNIFFLLNLHAKRNKLFPSFSLLNSFDFLSAPLWWIFEMWFGYFSHSIRRESFSCIVSTSSEGEGWTFSTRIFCMARSRRIASK